MTPNFRQMVKNLIPQVLLVTRLNQGANNSNSLLLTFDDGPDPEITPKVLSLLNEYDARAVFFVVGHRIKNGPHLLSAIHESGHELGNHTYIHLNQGEPDFFVYWRDLKRCQNLIQQYTGKLPVLFRPPSGRISPKSLLASRLVGLRAVNWSLGVKDWQCRSMTEAKAAANKIIQSAKPRDIILLHDDNPYVVDILQFVLPYFKSEGFDLASGREYLI